MYGKCADRSGHIHRFWTRIHANTNCVATSVMLSRNEHHLTASVCLQELKLRLSRHWCSKAAEVQARCWAQNRPWGMLQNACCDNHDVLKDSKSDSTHVISIHIIGDQEFDICWASHPIRLATESRSELTDTEKLQVTRIYNNTTEQMQKSILKKEKATPLNMIEKNQKIKLYIIYTYITHFKHRHFGRFRAGGRESVGHSLQRSCRNWGKRLFGSQP